MLNANVSLETFYLLWSWANMIILFYYQKTFLLCCFPFVCLPASFFLAVILSYWAFFLDFSRITEEVSCTTLLLVKYLSPGFFASDLAWVKSGWYKSKIDVAWGWDWLAAFSSCCRLPVYGLKGKMLANQSELQNFTNYFGRTNS